MNILPAVLLFLAGSGIGFFKASGLKKRVQTLTQYLALLRWTDTRLQYRRDTIKKLLTDAAQQRSFPPLTHCLQQTLDPQQFSVCWSTAVTTTLPHLTTAERAVCCQFGDLLGSATTAEQRKGFAVLLQSAEELLSTVKEKAKQESVLYCNLGIFGGLFLAIMVL